MTARKLLGRRVWWLKFALRACFTFGLAVVSLNIVFGKLWSHAVPLSALAVAFVVTFVAYSVALRCPRCRGKVARLLLQRSLLHLVPFTCPHCGLGWDEELPAEPPVEPPD